MKSKSKIKADDFLEKMNLEPAEPTGPSPKPRIRAVRHASRLGLKHIGGYFDPETVEKVAVLRVRLNKDNSELLKLAIDELYARHSAKRAHGDA